MQDLFLYSGLSVDLCNPFVSIIVLDIYSSVTKTESFVIYFFPFRECDICFALLKS